MRRQRWLIRDSTRVWFAVAVLGIVVAAVRRIGLPYLVYTLIMVAVPLSMGPPVYKSLLRYLVAAFPLCLVFARRARRTTVDIYWPPPSLSCKALF